MIFDCQCKNETAGLFVGLKTGRNAGEVDGWMNRGMDGFSQFLPMKHTNLIAVAVITLGY